LENTQTFDSNYGDMRSIDLFQVLECLKIQLLWSNKYGIL